MPTQQRTCKGFPFTYQKNEKNLDISKLESTETSSARIYTHCHDKNTFLEKFTLRVQNSFNKCFHTATALEHRRRLCGRGRVFTHYTASMYNLNMSLLSKHHPNSTLSAHLCVFCINKQRNASYLPFL